MTSAAVTSSVPRVSVVVIVYNGEDFLAEALQSIVAQTSADWEAIVVDDGSTDDTAAIIERFTQQDERFIAVRHEGGGNRGMSASRNAGVARARGEYITFLDHDDIMLPEKLAAQQALLDAHPDAGAVIGPNLRWFSWAGTGAEDRVQELGLPVDEVLPPPGPIPVCLRVTPSTPQAPMVRRRVFDEVGGYVEGFPGMYEDQAFHARLFLSASVIVSDDVWQWYRQHEDSCVCRAHRAGTHLVARRRFLKWLRRELDDMPALRDELDPIIDVELRRTRFPRLRSLIRRLG